jgi:hypothetical protein
MFASSLKVFVRFNISRALESCLYRYILLLMDDVGHIAALDMHAD